MTVTEISELLVNTCGADVIVRISGSGLQPALFIHPERIVQVCLELRNNPATWFDFLSSISGVDHGVNEKKFSVVYHLASIPHKKQLTLKVEQDFDRETEDMPVFASVSSVWRTAEWHERETYDFFGIRFDGNPDLRRILLPDDWEGFPLRKDYKTAEYYKGIKIDF